MYTDDKNRLTENINWFNQFFRDIDYIYENIWNQLPDIFFPQNFDRSKLKNINDKCNNFHYPTNKSFPTIPEYYVRALQGDKYALQIFTIYSPKSLLDNKFFQQDYSFVIIMFSDIDNFGWYKDYGLRIMKNRKLENIKKNDVGIVGKFITDKEIEFFAFQIPMNKFSIKKNEELELEEVIQKEIINPIFDFLSVQVPQS